VDSIKRGLLDYRLMSRGELATGFGIRKRNR